MQPFCPNLSNKNIKAEFEELKAVLGENLAYLVWHRTKGEGLGNHPGLTDSEAFQTVLNDHLDDRNEAIMAVAELYLHTTEPISTVEWDTAQSAFDFADLLDNERKEYVDRIVEQYAQTINDETEEQKEQKIAVVRNRARIQFNKEKLAKLRPDGSIPKNIKDMIIAALSEEDLHQAEGIESVVEQAAGTYNQSKHLTDKDKSVFQLIRQGTRTRLRSQLSRNVHETGLIDRLKKLLSMMREKDENSVLDVFDTIEEFLTRADVEINRTVKYIKVDIGDDLSKWDPQRINYIRQDLIGYYEGLLKSIKSLFNEDSACKALNDIRKADPANMDLEQMAETLYKTLVNLQEDYQSTVVLPYAEKVLVDFVNDSDVVTDKEAFIRNMKTWLHQDTMYGDLAAGEVVLGMASRSRSSIVKVIEKMISDVEFERNRRVLQKGKELIRIYNEIRPAGSQISFSNFQKTFIELDGEDGRSGMPTGYWVRDRNYGRFYKEKDEFEAKLRDKYAKKGLTWEINEYTDRIELIFPEEDHRADNSVYNLYYDELDEWLDKHCERRYKLEYYKKKRRFLSPAALKALSYLQHKIDILVLNAIDEDGWVDTNKLDLSERQELINLRKAKRELASPYIFSTTSDNIVTLEEKVGEEAEIAELITAWNKYIRDHVLYKENKEKFEQALAKFPEGSIERRRFLADNYITVINPELFEAIELWWNGAFTPYGVDEEQLKEYEDLKRRYRSIINHIKPKEGYIQHDLSKLGTGLNQDSSVWQELKRLDERMAEIKRETDEKFGKTLPSMDPEQDDQSVPQYTTTFLIGAPMSNTSFYDYLHQLYVRHPGAIGDNMDNFRKLFMYTDADGKLRILKAFGMLGPSKPTFKFDPNDEEEEEKPSLIKVYSSQFSDLDENSDFVNTKWKKELKTSLQPKVRKQGTHRKAGTIDYTNDQYTDVINNPQYKRMYDALIDTMNEANSMIPARAIDRQYLMPLITGRGMQVLGRSRSILDIQNAVGYMFQDVFTAKFSEKDGDVSTNWDLPRRPDGTVVNNIPVRFVKRLEKPELISTDVIGSVILYYDMAVNYGLKSENLPSLELIKEAVNPERSAGANKLPKQFEKIENLLNFRYYGKEDILGDPNKAPSEVNKKMTNIGKKFRSLASMSMLAINFTTIEVGYLDAFLGAIADAVGGKYFTKADLAYGYGEVLKHLPYIIANIGNPETSDWMISAMQYNNLSRSNSEIFDRTDQSRFRKALNQVRMGGYTMADYLINTMILGATYHHYRLVDLPDGSGKKFMSLTDAINTYTKFGYTEEQAIEKWESSKTTLKLAYYVKDGVFTVKDDYKEYVTKRLENQIAGRLRDRTAVYNGIIPTVEKAKLQQNVWGSYLTLMRNFYVNTYWERAQAGYDTAAEEDLKSSRFGMRSADSAGMVNFETGEFGNGLWWSFLKGIYKYVCNVKTLLQGGKDFRQLTRDQRYAVKRIFAEMLIIGASCWTMLLSIAFARGNDYDDDKTPAWTVNIFDPNGEDRGLILFNGKNFDKKFTNWLRWKTALLATRTFTERSTFYWPGTVTELISSPSTAKSYLDDLGYNLELLMDLFEINGHDRTQLVKTGGYAGMTRGTRDILKITGFTGIDNVVRGWHTSGIKSTLNWYQQVSPNNFLIPSKSVWLEEQGLTRKGNLKSDSEKKSNKSKY